MKRFNRNFLIGVLGCAGLVACGTPGVPIPPALELARPVTDLRAARKGDKVFLAWTVPAQTVDHQIVRHPGPTRVCRSLQSEIGACKTPAAEIPATQFPVPAFDMKKGAVAPKIQASYVDTLLRELQAENPSGELTYAVSVLNENGKTAGLSNLVQVPAASTMPPPEHFSAQVESDGVLLSWACQPVMAAANLQYRLRIYRREVEPPALGKKPAVKPTPEKGGTKISDENFGDCPQSAFLDQTFEWEKYYDYFATVVSEVSRPGKSEGEVEGDDTPLIHVFAHDTFPPAVPTGLQAVFSGVGQAAFIDVAWSPDTESDLVGYNVFRHEAGAAPVKMNPDLVKAPAYRDTNVQAGKKYFYSVSAVDERNNQSAPSEEASEQVP